MKEMKPHIDEPKKKMVSDEIDLPLGEIEAKEKDEAEELTKEDREHEGKSWDKASDEEKSIEDREEILDAEARSEDEREKQEDVPRRSFDDEDGPTQEDIEEENAYLARRAARAERARIRKCRRRRKKMLVAGLSAAAVVVLAAGLYFGGEFKNKMQDMEKLLSEKISSRQEEKSSEEESVQANTQAEPEMTQVPESTQEDEQKTEEDTLIRRARRYGRQYDYDRAIRVLKKSDLYEKSERLQEYAAKYEEKKASCVAWPVEEVTHVFYHSLVVDTSKAFDGDNKSDGLNQVMTTVDEFNKITQSMYDKGYVMVSIKDMATVDENGNMVPGEILLPPGKIPFVLSQDDVCYYHYMDNNGFATKLVVDEDGKVRNEYVNDDGSVSVGDYDMVPLIDRFVEEHPDFSYRGAKGIVALTGYNGILGYRTDISYQTRPEDLDADKVQWLDAHPDFDLEAERAEAQKVAEAMKKEGWLFASHTWGHLNVKEISMERLERDTQKFKENVDPLIGGTDIIIFAFGADLTQSEDYSGEKFDFLKSQGYNYFCNVDSQKYFVQLRDNYLRMGRRNLDGYRMYYNPEMLDDLFDASAVFDQARPVPVAPMG